jgi:hypothetical protein
METSLKLIMHPGCTFAHYEGIGDCGRQYSIRRSGREYSATLIEGEGQPITATGRTPMIALQRAESVQIPY